MYRFFVGLSVVVGLAGCASTYSIPTSIPSAEIFVTAGNNPSAVTSRNVYLWAFKDEQCTASDHGTLAGRSNAFGSSALAAQNLKRLWRTTSSYLPLVTSIPDLHKTDSALLRLRLSLRKVTSIRL